MVTYWLLSGPSGNGSISSATYLAGIAAEFGAPAPSKTHAKTHAKTHSTGANDRSSNNGSNNLLDHRTPGTNAGLEGGDGGAGGGSAPKLTVVEELSVRFDTDSDA